MTQDSGDLKVRRKYNIIDVSRPFPRRIDLCARALITDQHGRVLLAKPKFPADGRWELPGGQVRDGETCTMAMVRSLHDNLGILTWPVSVVFIHDQCCGADRRHLLSITYSVSVIAGALCVAKTGQLDEAGWFHVHALPQGIADEALNALNSREAAAFKAS